MKKLMTMIAAVGMAFGLFADSYWYNGTSFDTNPVDVTAITPTGAGITTTAFTDAVTPYPDASRPTKFKGVENVNYGAIKTTLGTPVSAALATPVTIGSGLYFDSVVSFTAFDEDPNFGAYKNAKIAIYLQEMTNGEEVVATNLFVRAYNPATSKVQNFNCGVANDLTGWHRLTIKAIANITMNETPVPGFVVFIDTQKKGSLDAKTICAGLNLKPAMAEYATDGYLFPSIDQTSDAAGKIAAVDFDGQGGVDDLLFTDDPDFATDPTKAYITFGNTVAEISIDGGQSWLAASPVLVDADGEDLTVMWHGADGYCDGAKTFEGGIGDGDSQPIDEFVKQASFKIGTTSYATLSNAFAGATVNGAMIEVVADYTLAKDEVAVLNNAAGATTLDLAGKVITGNFSASTALTVMDSVAKVSDLYVGKIDGTLTASDNCDITINSGYVKAIEVFTGYTFVNAITVNGGQFGFDPGHDDAVTTVPDTKYVKVITANTLWEVVAKTAIEKPTAVQNLTYDGNPKTGVNEGTGYTLSGNVQTDAGSYQATATLKAGYIWSDESTEAKTIDWSIAQATPTITTAPTASAEIEKGAELNTIGLTGGVGSVAGSFAWTAPTTKVDADGNYSVTFTPTDAKNYTTATCQVAVTVKQGGWNPDPTEDYGTSATTKYPGLPATFAGADAGLVGAWAADPTKGNLKFEDIDKAKIEAFLLDCANTTEAINAAKANYKFSAIVPGETPTITGAGKAAGFYGNGQTIVQGKDELTDASWGEVKATTKFYQATLTPYILELTK